MSSSESFNSTEVDVDKVDDELDNKIILTGKEILDTEFENYDKNLLLIDIPFEIKVGTQFLFMLVAVHFVEQYAYQKWFAVFKHKNEKFKDGIYRKKVLKYDLRGKYSEKLSKPALDKQKNKG
ncbi:5879_t:CDS:1, partial [Racocetra persica]